VPWWFSLFSEIKEEIQTQRHKVHKGRQRKTKEVFEEMPVELERKWMQHAD